MCVTKKDLEELKKQLNQERDKEDKGCSSEEEDSNKKGRMPTGDIKKNAVLLGRVSVFGYKVASQQSLNEQTLCLGWRQVSESL